MKNYLILVGLLLSLGLSAQIEPEKALKKASRELGTYNLDQIANTAKLDEAKSNIEIATTNEPTQGMASAWITKGQIYNEICGRDLRNKMMDPNYKSSFANAPLEAYDAFEKALTLNPKKWEIKDAIKGLAENSGNLINYGIQMYDEQKYSNAYSAFNGVLMTHEKLKANGEKSILDKEDEYNNQLYITGLSAMNSGKNSEAIVLFDKLYKANYDKPAIYDALYKLNADKDINAAYQYLEAGRLKFPDDIGLLFTEINHYLKLNKMETLIDKLKLAIQKEPNNVSLYTTLGNVYDNLQQKDTEANNVAKAKENFDNAETYYKSALEKDPKNFDSNYSLGTLYFNKAAALTKALNSMPDDFSKEGQKKYDAKKAEIGTFFEKALPYFKSAESIDPNDKNTLLALKEIFARMNDANSSNEFKKRLENVDKGIKNQSAFFK